MSLKNKLNLWVQNALITPEEKEKILTFEQNRNNGFFSKSLFIVASIFIGLGICLVVASNWEAIGACFKFIIDFAVFGAFLYGVYYGIRKQNNALRDVFLFLSFLMVGATIGLTGQVFHLSGGWMKFALFWAVLSLPYVLLSGSVSLNTVWSILLFSALIDEKLLEFLSLYLNGLEGCIALVLSFSALSYFAEQGYIYLKKRILLPHAMAKLSLMMAYFFTISIALSYGLRFYHKEALAVLFVLGFLGVRLFFAFQRQDICSFKHNIFLLEGYIFCYFFSLFGGLLMTGFGFIFCGLFILLLVYVFKKTSKYFKNGEFFK